MTTKKAVKKVEKNRAELQFSDEVQTYYVDLTSYYNESEREKERLNLLLKEAEILNLTKTFLLFTAGMLAGAVIMKFL